MVKQLTDTLGRYPAVYQRETILRDIPIGFLRMKKKNQFSEEVALEGNNNYPLGFSMQLDHYGTSLYNKQTKSLNSHSIYPTTKDL